MKAEIMLGSIGRTGSTSARAAALLLGAALVLSGCGGSETAVPETNEAEVDVVEEVETETETIVMPDVEGSTLELALSDLERAGITRDPEIIGGGTFGPIDKAAWEVCSQLPAAGETLDWSDEPRLVIERDCDGEDSEEAEAPAKDDQEADDSPAATEEEAVAAPAVSGPTAAEVEAKYLEHLAMPFSAMCDDYYTHWACFYQGVEGDPSNFLQVNLLTDGGWSDFELDAMAETAGRHWFNFIGCDFPQINTIVVNINGLDHNVFRYDWPDICG